MLRVIHNGNIGKSEFQEWRIRRNIGRYVPTKDFTKAEKKLHHNKFVIITGLPGIGKTTLSYLLVYQYLAKDYRLVVIDNNLSEAETQFNNEKVIFYYDDFLGSNILELLNQKNTPNSLINFIQRVQHSKNKFLILTTRTSNLQKAEQKFEKIEQEKLTDISRYEIELSKYSLVDRAKILYNHIYHSDLNERYKDAFYKDKFYMKIVRH